MEVKKKEVFYLSKYSIYIQRKEEEVAFYTTKQTDDTIWCKYYQLLLECYVFIDDSHKKKLFYKLAMGSVIFHKTGKILS